MKDVRKKFSYLLKEEREVEGWRQFWVKLVDYIDVERHVGLSPAALCAASLWGAAISLMVPGIFPTVYYLRTALLLFLGSVVWNAAFAAKRKSQEAPMRRFIRGMGEFFGLLIVAAARQPFSFWLAGLPFAMHSPYRWVAWALAGIFFTLNLVRLALMREDKEKEADDRYGTNNQHFV